MREPKLQFQAALCREINAALNQKQPGRPMPFPNEEAFAFFRQQLLSSRHQPHRDHSVATDHFLAFEGEHVVRTPSRVAVKHRACELQISIAGIRISAVEVANVPKKVSSDWAFNSFDPD
jgi:hypothetical protein